jgi:hypothetical protein
MTQEDKEMLNTMIDGYYAQATPKEQKKFQKFLKGILKNETATLTFQKKDGTMRVMKCSLREDHMPSYEKKTERVRATNEETLSVVDLEKNEWRSFRYDSIRRIEFSIG